MSFKPSHHGPQGPEQTIPHDLGIEDGDAYERATLGYLEAGPRVRAAVRAALADESTWSALDHESYKEGCVRRDQRSGRGQYVLEAVLEFLLEDQGYTLREAMDTLVLEAVRVAANADHARRRLLKKAGL